jgi:outer membrane protein assembly factor BamB
MRATAAILLCLIFGVPLRAQWPQFRGPSGDGRTSAQGLPLTWSSSTNITWQIDVPGRGWSSPIVSNGKVWLTTAEETSRDAEERTNRLAKSAEPANLQTHADVTLRAIAVTADTGKIVGNYELFVVRDPAPIHANNSYATPTAVSDGKRLYCHFGSLGTACVDESSGNVVWKKTFPGKFITGPASSPVLWRDLLLLTCDAADEQYVVALDKRTGEQVWKTPRPALKAQDEIQRRAFSTPLAIEHAGREQLIVPGAEWVVSYDPTNGKELWRVNFGDGYSTVPRPVYADGLVYICTGFTKPQLWAIRANGTGDVTATHVVWRYQKQVPEIASPVVADGVIAFVSTGGVATALDAKAGELLWQQRLGGVFSASPLAAQGRLYFTNEDGVTTVVATGREYKELGKNFLFGPAKASLAVDGKGFIIRTDTQVLRVQNK